MEKLYNSFPFSMCHCLQVMRGFHSKVDLRPNNVKSATDYQDDDVVIRPHTCLYLAKPEHMFVVK